MIGVQARSCQTTATSLNKKEQRRANGKQELHSQRVTVNAKRARQIQHTYIQ